MERFSRSQVSRICWNLVPPRGILLLVLIVILMSGTARADFDNSTRINTNLLDVMTTNYGSFGRDLETGHAGLFYPNGTDRTVGYSAGLWMGAKVDGNLRVTVAEYTMECGPGTITGPGQWADPEDDRFRTYKISPGDTPEDNRDFAEWPAGDGAPLGSDGNPRVMGDQTLWSVWNDLDPARHTNDAGASAPLGIEVRQTTFADYQFGALERTVFIEWKILNKSGQDLEDAYISAWMDPDLGGASDDLVGCDSLMSLGYCYNGGDDDDIYGSTPPSVGIDLVQGPIVPSPGDMAYVSGQFVPDFKNLPMTSFARWINGTDPSSPAASYNYMRGLDAGGAVVIDPTTGRPTKFCVPGDPVSGQGWIDANNSDRRMFLTSGPFNMAPGDSQVVAVAIIVGHGQDRLASVTSLKQNAQQAPELFRTLIESPQPPRNVFWTWYPEPRWLTGVGAGLRTFFGGIGFGSEFFGSTVADDDVPEVKIRFDSSETTVGARYDRNQGYAYVGSGTFRGSAYDISDRAHPRRLNICFTEHSHVDGMWEPDTTDIGGREYLFILNSDYDEGIGYNDENWGPSADVLYAAWLRVRSYHDFLETDPAELILYFNTSAAVEENALPSTRSLPALAGLRCSPNPATEKVTFSFELARPASVTLSVIDATGREVDQPITRVLMRPGTHQIPWAPRPERHRPASGVYFWRVQAEDEVQAHRIVFVR